MSDLETNTIHTGDVREVLPDLPANSVHMCMTSPPYFGLRDYGVDEQIGLEESLDEYIQNLVRVGDELRRVLRPDGSWWLNLGDTYEDKQKLLVPHRVAIALQEDGWVVRNDVTWLKPSPMPQSVKDRLNTTTEQIFHLVPEPDYWYDLDAIREPHATAEHHERYHGNGQDRPKQDSAREQQPVQHELGQQNTGCHPAGKNPGDVFEVTTKPFPDAHFAVYPPELCGKPLKATCPPKVCAACGTPYERDVERETVYDHETTEPAGVDYGGRDPEGGDGHDIRNGVYSQAEFNGWQQDCDCDTDATESGIALDPFAGAGTTLLKAKELGRRFVGIELNPEYADMARARVGLAPNDPSNVRENDAQQGLESFGANEES